MSTLNQALAEKELEGLRTSVNRGRPWGGDNWVRQTAQRLGLLFTLRNSGSPPKTDENE